MRVPGRPQPESRQVPLAGRVGEGERGRGWGGGGGHRHPRDARFQGREQARRCSAGDRTVANPQGALSVRSARWPASTFRGMSFPRRESREWQRGPLLVGAEQSPKAALFSNASSPRRGCKDRGWGAGPVLSEGVPFTPRWLHPTPCPAPGFTKPRRAGVWRRGAISWHRRGIQSRPKCDRTIRGPAAVST